MITLDTLLQYFKIGFKLVPLNDLSMSPMISWSEIYNNIEFWSTEKLREYEGKFLNTATTFGKSHIKDDQGKDLFLFCLDIDSDEILERIFNLLENEWNPKTF